jgi:DNA processing protein
VVPGPVTSAMSVGCHAALRDYPGVRLVTGLPHVLEEVGRIGVDLAPPTRGPVDVRDGLDADATQVLEAMPIRRAVGPDEIAARAGVDLRTTLRKLGMLTSLGLLKRVDGAYVLTRPPNRTRAAPATAATTARDTGDGAPP